VGQWRGYTGQRWEAGIGLYDYNARYYDPALGRFVQADTVVPSMESPQDLNRYSYVRGNPLKYTDPTGHITEQEAPEANGIVAEMAAYGIDIFVDWKSAYGAWIGGNWLIDELRLFKRAVLDFAGSFSDTSPGHFRDFTMDGNRISVVRANDFDLKAELAVGKDAKGRVLKMKMRLGDALFEKPVGFGWVAKVGIVHELAHAWDHSHGNRLSKGLVRYANGEPAPTEYGATSPRGATDEWAESVAAFVYPAYTAGWLRNSAFPNHKREMAWARKYSLYNLPGLGPRHRIFVNLAVYGMENLARW
jgi:RHS repeat-associated protein